MSQKEFMTLIRILIDDMKANNSTELSGQVEYEGKTYSIKLKES
jgi:hypothetical protein